MTKRVLVISPEAVFPTNAGGRVAVLAQCAALTEAGFAVDLLVFHRERMSEVDARRHRDIAEHVFFVRRRGLIAASLSRPGSPYQLSSRWLSRARARAVRSALPRPDLVVAQQEWTIQAAAALHRGDPIPTLLSSHNDELAYFRDQLHAARGLRRPYLRMELPRVQAALPALLSAADAVVTLSAQDEAAYRGLPARTIPYPLPAVDGARRDRSGGANVLFVGALDMPHAVDGLLWFVHDVWPMVIRRVPGARFHIAGRRASSSLRAELANIHGVVFHGEVPDVEPLYADADVFVNPVFLGSGINIKLADPIGRGIPSVTTSMGARGYEHLADALRVADDAAGFSDQCVLLLTDSRAALRSSQALVERAAATSPAVVAQLWREAVLDL